MLVPWVTAWAVALLPCWAQICPPLPTVTLQAAPDACVGGPHSCCWNGVVAKGLTYRVQFDRHDTFTGPVEHSTGSLCLEQTWSSSGLWFWRVRAETVCETGPWTAADAFVVRAMPGTPSPALPEAGAVVCSGDTRTFHWSAVSGATGYHIQWANNPAFTSAMEAFPSSASILRVMNGLGPWYWRVRAGNDCGWGDWSTSRTMELQIVPSNAVLLEPADGMNVCSGPIYFSWAAVPSAEEYEIQWSQSSVFDGFINQMTTGLATINTFNTGPDWYWRVRAMNTCATGTWSEVRAMRPVSLPLTPTLIEPSQLATFCPDEYITFYWSAAYEVVRHELQFDEASDFSSPEDIYFTTNRVAALRSPGSWHWRVRAVTVCGPGDWSTAGQFQVEAPLDAVLLNTPLDGAGICMPDPVHFHWQVVSNAAQYHLQFDDNYMFGSPGNFLVEEPSTTLYPMPGTWYWRVRAKGLCSDGPWSETREMVMRALPVAPDLLTPSDEHVSCEEPVTFTWSWVEGADLYQLRIEDDEDFVFISQYATNTYTYTLPHTGLWRWTVGCRNSCSDWVFSPVRTITQYGPLTEPQLLEPAGGAVMYAKNDIPVTFRWTPIAEATHYQLYIGDDPLMHPSSKYECTNAWNVHPLYPRSTPYYWRVIAENPCGTTYSPTVYSLYVLDGTTNAVHLTSLQRVEPNSLDLAWTVPFSGAVFRVEFANGYRADGDADWEQLSPDAFPLSVNYTRIVLETYISNRLYRICTE